MAVTDGTILRRFLQAHKEQEERIKNLSKRLMAEREILYRMDRELREVYNDPT